ncbi:MAG: hypothetical protein JO250_07905, partial [Armatimonadetes bacterium]|nr:hypothetical protein [Armatimonadota bacterium]
LEVTKTQSGPITGALGASLSYFVDYKIVPKQFTPGIEKKLSRRSVLAAYLALGITLALSRLWNKAQEQRP